jgi:hypothetical protein
MNKRYPGFKVADRAVLKDYRWIINTRGFANVIPSKGDFVEGVLYWLTEDDENRLDKKEGVASGSYRKEELVVLFNGQSTPTLVYGDPIIDEGSPSAEYVKRINAGQHDAQLSKEYVANHIRPAIEKR